MGNAHTTFLYDLLYDDKQFRVLEFSIGRIAIQRNMLVAMRSDAQTFVKTLVEQMYEDIDRLETQIVRNQQEDPLVIPPLLVTLEEQP